MKPAERQFWGALLTTAVGFVPGVLYCCCLELGYQLGVLR